MREYCSLPSRVYEVLFVHLRSGFPEAGGEIAFGSSRGDFLPRLFPLPDKANADESGPGLAL